MHSSLEHIAISMPFRICTCSYPPQTIDNFVAAMSSASTSAVNRAKAFFDPSGLQRIVSVSDPTHPGDFGQPVPDRRTGSGY